MGLFANAAKQVRKETEGKFKPLELCEVNVQAISNRCLATENSKETTASSLYFSSLGWEKEDDGLLFVKNQIRANQKKYSIPFRAIKASSRGTAYLNIREYDKDLSRNQLGHR